MDLKGKKVIVTGGVSGIGRSLVSHLHERETDICVLDINKNGLSDLKDEIPEVDCIYCDITDPEQVETSINNFYEDNGRIDVLVNNAGILFNAPLVSLTADGLTKHSLNDWNNVININLTSVFLMTANVVEKMIMRRTKGVVVNISSVSAGGNAGQSAYSASKAAVNALTKTWAKELSPMGIRFVGVAPGFTNTASTHEVMKEDTLKRVTSEIPLRRIGKVEEIASGIISAIENDFFNGKILEIDGGLVV